MDIEQDSDSQTMEHSGDSGVSASQTDGEEQSYSAETIFNLIKARQWLENQLKELKTQYASGHKKQTAKSGDPDKVLDHIAELQSELQETSGNIALRTKILSRVQHGELLLHYLFPAQGSGDAKQITEEQQQKHKLVTDVVMKQTQLATNIARIHQTNQAKMQSLNELKSRSLGLKQNVRELMHHLVRARENQSQEQQDQEDEQVTRGRDKLAHVEAKTELVRHLFQALILGSGVNWAEDEELRDLILGLGRPVEDLTL